MTNSEDETLTHRHFSTGWWGLLFFLSMGLGLELLHGFKADFYLDVSSETRRHLWTLSHAHGGLISLVHIGFAATTAQFQDWRGIDRLWAARCLTAALVLVPGGFFLGGLYTLRAHGDRAAAGIAVGVASSGHKGQSTCSGGRS